MILQFGTVCNPVAVLRGIGCTNDTASVDGTGGLLALGTGVIRLLIVAAGLFALFNFIFAGIQMITSEGDPKKMEAARSKIIMSVVGLAIVAASFMLAAVLGLLFFGDATIFLTPKIYEPIT